MSLQEAAKTLETSLKALGFGEVSVKDKIILSNCILFQTTNGTRDSYPFNIAMNDKGWTKGLISQDSDGVWVCECPTTYYSMKKTGIKFRKITGKTPEEVATKLIAWYTKNADAIKALSN